MTDTSGSDSPRKIYDVLIVGAGPVGLATAIGLRKRGINNILVIDQTREFRKVGQGLDLLPNGLRAIKHIDTDAYEKIVEKALNTIQSSGSKPPTVNPVGKKEHSTPPPKKLWRQKNIHGETTRSFSTDFQSWFDRYGEGRVNISWFDLQTNLRSLIPIEDIKANHKCIHIEEEEKWVRVDTASDAIISDNPFAHWEMMKSSVESSALTQDTQESDHKSFYAKLVVAADGINSNIRQVLYKKEELKKWVKPQYSGFSAISSTIANVPSSIVKELDSLYIQEEQFTTLHNNSENLAYPELKLLRIILIRLPNDTIIYLLYAPFDIGSFLNKSPAEILELGKQTLQKADFPSILVDLVGLSSPEKVSHRLFYMHQVNTQDDSQPHWYKGRVVLSGDAAHAMPPFMAQGANQGFEDAAILVSLITKLSQENGFNDEHKMMKAFEKYEQIRMPFAEKVQDATMNCHQWTQQQWDEFNEILHRREYPSVETLGE